MLSDEGYLIETLLRIPDKEGNDVDFVLNSAQRELDENLTGRDLVPKARQEGISSYVLARFLMRCISKRNTRAVVISHDAESTQRLLARVRYYIDNMKGAEPVVANMSKNEITFPKTNSMFFIGTAGSKKFGRGDTITNLHCSEYAFWPNPKELMTGLLQAVPKTGEIIIESTGNGFNDYHKRCMNAYTGKSIYKCHFFPWHTFDEYELEMTDEEKEYLADNLNEDWEEPNLYEQGVSLEKLLWRRVKLDELEYDLTQFKQEYPWTLDECFQMSSESIFTKVNYTPSKDWVKIDNNTWGLSGHPNKNYTYVAGADVAGGVGKDSSTIEIFCLELGVQVLEYSSNRIDPEYFAHKIKAICLPFHAYVVPEQNNHGILTVAVLRDIYPPYLLHKTPDPAGVEKPEETRLMKMGYKTSVRTKPLMIGRLRGLLGDEWTIHSAALKDQLSTFIEHENGRLAAQEGCEDDLVMGAACAGVGVNKAALLAGGKGASHSASISADPFSLDGIIEELHARGRGFPIPPQHRLN